MSSRIQALLLALGLLAVSSCGGQSEASFESGDPEVDLSSGGAPGFLESSVDAPWTLVYRGIRRVRLNHVAPGVDYREEVGADGQGKFAITTLNVQSPHPDPEMFLILQDLRRTLSYRYRDFAIKDWDLFQQQYVVAVLDAGKVAGIPTVKLRIERTSNARSIYEVDFDPGTGMVMAYVEYDLFGQILADVAFESFEYDADLTGLDLITHLFPTSSHDLTTADLGKIFDFDPLIPSYVPQGYVLTDTIDKQDAPDGIHAKVYLSDGLETVILSSQAPVSAPGVTPSKVWSLDLGSWCGLSGQVRGYPVIVAGKAGSQEQELVLQSALK